MKNWPTRPLSHFLLQRNEEYRSTDASKETFVTVRLYGKGAVKRKVGDGKVPIMKSGYRLRSGDLVYSRIDARNGAFALVPDELNGAVVSKDFPTFEINRDVMDPQFLSYFLGSEKFFVQLQASSFGTTNRQRIPEELFLSYQVPVPPMPEQKRFVKFLNEADNLQKLRARADLYTANLIPALFTEIFGNPTLASDRWPRLPLGDFGTITTGNTPSRKNDNFFGEYIEWVKTDNIDASRGIVTKAVEGLSADGAKAGRVVPPGTVLVTCIAGSRDRIGDAAVIDRQVAINQQINAIIPNSETNPAFLCELVRALKPVIQHRTTGVMTGIINKSSLAAIPAIRPPMSLQNEFAEQVAQIRALRAEQAASRQRLDDLFQSMHHRAFSGDL